MNKKNVLGPTIVWFRQDLRVTDNPALFAAVARKAPILPLYIWSENEESPWFLGSASKVWLHQSLLMFSEELDQLGLKLIIRQGNTLNNLNSLTKDTGAQALFFCRRYEPHIIKRDEKIQTILSHNNLLVQSFNSSLLYEPWQIKQKYGKPYQVFTAFWQACAKYGEPREPLAKPLAIIRPKKWPKTLKIKDLKLMPAINWAEDIKEFWPAGSEVAKKRCKQFIKNGLKNYRLGRDRPDLAFVSYLSPYLHLGQISPHQIYNLVKAEINCSKDKEFYDSAQIYLKEIGWREFAHHLLFHFPQTPTEPLKKQYAKFSWQSNNAYLKAWQKGKTGYPIVDAGMRQLWQLGWMHNRVRMIVASFLVKDLLINWQEGAQWFWDTLVDADLANNTLGWQWSAGCGADAVPYFRVFNPISQGQKFDPQAIYIKQYVPELKNLPLDCIHNPWLASDEVLKQAKLKLGKDYPYPIVDHNKARLEALTAWRQIKNGIINTEYD